MIDSITLLRAAEAGLPAAESHPDPALVCFPMRADWDQQRLRDLYPEGAVYEYRKSPLEYGQQFQELLTGRQPFPAPLQPAQVMPLDSWPDPVEKLAAHAALFGWVFDVRRAEGFTPHASYGTPSARSKVSWALRMARPHERAVAVRMDGGWTSLWFWSETQLMKRINGLEAFYAILGVTDGQL